MTHPYLYPHTQGIWEANYTGLVRLNGEKFLNNQAPTQSLILKMQHTRQVVNRGFGDRICPVQHFRAGAQGEASSGRTDNDELRGSRARFEKRVGRLKENFWANHIDLRVICVVSGAKHGVTNDLH